MKNIVLVSIIFWCFSALANSESMSVEKECDKIVVFSQAILQMDYNKMSKDNIVEVMVALGEAYDLQPRFLTSNNFVLPYTTKISGPEKSLENATALYCKMKNIPGVQIFEDAVSDI